MTRTQRQKWYELASDLQNEPENIHADKMTIMGMMKTPNEMMSHVESMAIRCKRHVEVVGEIMLNLESYGYKS